MITSKATRPISRRTLLSGLSLATATVCTSAFAQSGNGTAADFGLVPDAGTDQSAALQQAIDSAAAGGSHLFVPAGKYLATDIRLPSNIKLSGISGATIFEASGAGSIFIAEDKANIILDGVVVDGRSRAAAALIDFRRCQNISLADITAREGNNNGVWLEACQGAITNSNFTGFTQNAIHAQNSTGLIISENHITDCANGGIRVWRYESGRDGTIVTDNQIANIGSQSGNGQNGNGVNIFNADEVIVANNAITLCDFSAVRANSTNNTLIRGNVCTQCKEVAIFSEFAFTGSIITDNLIDEAAFGISITNFNDGGRLSICSNNIVRNIWPSSPTNPDTRPVGIFAEADTAITSNVVENSPGLGILAGWGPYLRDVLVSNNVVRDTAVGIGVSVADGVGHTRITDNLIANASRAAINGFAWVEPVGTDLNTTPDQFDHVYVEGNSVS